MKFKVVTKHPTSRKLSGIHIFTIGATDIGDGRGLWYYASAPAFGTSKSYFGPQLAIIAMCDDHDVEILSHEKIED